MCYFCILNKWLLLGKTCINNRYKLKEGVFLVDTKFSVAIHILVMVDQSKEILSSQQIANSVGTNASYVRKVISLLKKNGLLVSHQGKIGYQLSKDPRSISLLEIYQATQETKHIQFFEIHSSTNQECPVGKYIHSAISPVFTEAEKQLEKELSTQTLYQVIDNLYQSAGKKHPLND